MPLFPLPLLRPRVDPRVAHLGEHHSSVTTFPFHFGVGVDPTPHIPYFPCIISLQLLQRRVTQRWADLLVDKKVELHLNCGPVSSVRLGLWKKADWLTR